MRAACALGILSGKSIFNFGMQKRLLAFLHPVFTGGVAKRCIPPFFARQTVLYYNSIGACRKGSKPVRFTQGSVSRARCTEKAVF